MRVHVQAEVSNAEPFMAYPLAQLAAAFALGILGAGVSAIPIPVLISFAVLATFLAVSAFLTNRIRLATILVTVLAFMSGSTLASIETSHIPENQLKRLLEEKGQMSIALGEPVEVTGVLKRDPEIAPDRWYLNVRVESIRSRGVDREAVGELLLLTPVSGARVKQELEQLELRYGARIRVMTLLERSDNFRNPGVSSFTEYLDRKGYDATGFVKSPLLIERLENTRVFLPLAWLYEWRRNLQEEIDARFSKETAGVLDAALLGNRYNLSRPTAERFREGGTFHVLVISGLHITFLGGLAFLFARRLTRNPAIRFSLSVGVVWAYSLAVGAEPSVVRAALMFTVVLLSQLVARRASSLNALGGAALALLVWRPSDLFDPSFQLTFVSVLAIVVFSWPLLKRASEIGLWRPTRETPVPPSAVPWLRTICECLFWSEREWKREINRTNYTYKLFKSPLAKTLERYHLQRALRAICAAGVVSVSVQIALLPFLVVYFHRLSIASLVLNIGVSVIMAAVATTAALGLLIAQISSTLAAPLISLTNSLNWLMVHSVDPFASMGVASIRMPEYSGWGGALYAVYYVPLITLAVLLARWHPLKLSGPDNQSLRLFASPLRSLRLTSSHGTNQTAKNSMHAQRFAKAWRSGRALTVGAGFVQLLAIALVVFHPFSEPAPEGTLRVDFLDVGQGDSALVTMPDNTTLLVDGGGRPGPFYKRAADDVNGDSDGTFERETRSIGEAVVSEYLWWRGLDHVDYILATHADADHIDGLNDVARNFSVRAALLARKPSGDAEYSRFSQVMTARGIPVQAIGAGDVLQFGNVSATVLWPAATEKAGAPSSNNDSVVLHLRFGERSILLAADIEAPAENALVRLDRARESQPELPGKTLESLRSDVVKVAHHGSRTSSTDEFVAATRARLAIIPVGQTSMFGHPHSEVVERWKASGAEVLTTGQRGTITVRTDGRAWSVRSFVQNAPIP